MVTIHKAMGRLRRASYRCFAFLATDLELRAEIDDLVLLGRDLAETALDRPAFGERV